MEAKLPMRYIQQNRFQGDRHEAQQIFPFCDIFFGHFFCAIRIRAIYQHHAAAKWG